MREVTGTIDAHTHVTAFEFLGGDFHCGRPWAPFGIPYALPTAPASRPAATGRSRASSITARRSTRTTPGLADLPRLAEPHDLAEEGDYYTGSSAPGTPGSGSW